MRDLASKSAELFKLYERLDSRDEPDESAATDSPASPDATTWTTRTYGRFSGIVTSASRSRYTRYVETALPSLDMCI